MPSRYEGVPLTMLEALSVGVPVIATDRDGMRDFLPPDWRFAGGDVAGMLACIDRMSGAPHANATRALSLAAAIPDVAQFGLQFDAAISRIVNA